MRVTGLGYVLPFNKGKNGVGVGGLPHSCWLQPPDHSFMYPSFSKNLLSWPALLLVMIRLYTAEFLRRRN
jgi:hypothetical protein